MVLFLSFLCFRVLHCVCPAHFLVNVNPLSSPRVPHFFGRLLVLLFCLCFSPVLCVSTPPTGFPSAVVRLVSVHGVAAAPAVLVVAPPLSRPLRLLYTPILRFICSGSFCIRSAFSAYCGYGCSFQSFSAFFRMLRLRLLLPIFLHVFPQPHAAALASPSSLPPRFPLAEAPTAPCAFGAAPINLLVDGSPTAVPRVPVPHTYGPIQEMARASKKCWLNITTTTTLHMVTSGFVLPVLVPALCFVFFFFSLVRPRRIACFGLGPFLCFLVTGSSLK